jgi:hypothetical protein
MDHREIEELISAHADGELTPAQREALDLHLAACADCQRSLAEFRLTRQQLALLADPSALAWRPDVAQGVTARIRRRRRWLGLGRRFALDAARALAAVSIVVAIIWLLPRLLTVTPDDTAYVAAPSQAASTREPIASPTKFSPTIPTVTLTSEQFTPVPPEPTSQPDPDLVYVALVSPDSQFTLHIFDADSLQQAPAPGALSNVGYRLSASIPAVYVVVEIVGGEQILLDLEQAPSIYLPPSAQPGDQVRIFATTSAGVTTPAAEFTLSPTGTLALNLHQTTAPRQVRVELPTPPPVVTLEPGIALELLKVSLDPAQPHFGETFDITAVIRNEGGVDARVPFWFNFYRGDDGALAGDQSSDPIFRVSVSPIDIPAGEEIEYTRNVEYGVNYAWNSASRLILLAGINVAQPGGSYRRLSPEDDTSDNVVESQIDFLPYQPLVSDACPPGDNLWVELGQPPGDEPQFPQPDPKLYLAIHNDGNVAASGVPLRLTDARGHSSLTYTRLTARPCDGVLDVHLAPPSSQFFYPITATLNPPDVFGALPESDHSDNVIVISADQACTGPTDLWMEDDDVLLEGDDLLITVHFAGSPPSHSFWLYAYHSQDGSAIVAKQIMMTSCVEQQTYRFEGVLAGLSGGFLMVQIDTEQSRVEDRYPQSTNTATVPLP